MKLKHLALVASYADNRSRVEHPVTDPASVAQVIGWLSPLVPGDVTWSVEEVA